MVARVRTVVFEGVDVPPVDAQVQVLGGMPAFTLVGPITATSRCRQIFTAFLWVVSLICIFLVYSPTPRALAASFDCAVSEAPLEKLICSTPEVSKLDEDLSSIYQETMGSVSESARGLLRQTQRDWLKYVRQLCGFALRQPRTSLGDAASCLSERYSSRISDLSLNRSIGTYRIIYLSDFETKPMPWDNGGGKEGDLVGHESIFAQADGATEPALRGWNAYVSDRVQRAFVSTGLEDYQDLSDYRVSYIAVSAVPGLISGEFTFAYITRGAPHPEYQSGRSNYLLSAGRELSPEDIFDPATPWRDGLTTQTMMPIKHEHPGTEISLQDVTDQVADPSRWRITDEAILVEVDMNILAGYGNGTTEVRIPWRDLKPYLRPDLPVTLNLD